MGSEAGLSQDQQWQADSSSLSGHPSCVLAAWEQAQGMRICLLLPSLSMPLPLLSLAKPGSMCGPGGAALESPSPQIIQEQWL